MPSRLVVLGSCCSPISGRTMTAAPHWPTPRRRSRARSCSPTRASACRWA